VIGGRETACPLGHQPLELLSASRQCLARLYDVGDIGAGAKPSDDLAAISHLRPTRLEPAILAICSTDTVFKVVFIQTFHCAEPALQHSLPVLGMDNPVEPPKTELLFLRDTGVFDPLAAEIIPLAIRPAGPDQLRERLRERAVTPLTDRQ